MNERLDELNAKLNAGEMLTYEDAADLFENTFIGRSYNLSRAEILSKLRAKFPTPSTLTARIHEIRNAFFATNNKGMQ